jgi:ferredoxin
MSTEMKIDTATCIRCGLCAGTCPAAAIEQEEKGFPTCSREGLPFCIECGQCMAICPTRSVTLGELTYGHDFFELPGGGLDYEAFFALAASRRSIRHFQDRPVSRELLEKIVAAVAQAPMGFPPHKTAVTVIQTRSAIERMLPLMIGFYEYMLWWMKNPLVRCLIRRDAGKEDFATIKNHLIPILERRVPRMKAEGKDEITWGAPAMLLFHASRAAENHTQDANIALAYGLLAAHSLGLGATAISLVPPAINKTRELRSMLQLTDDHEVVGCMILGYQRHKYQRGIRRSLAGVSWLSG